MQAGGRLPAVLARARPRRRAPAGRRHGRRAASTAGGRAPPRSSPGARLVAREVAYLASAQNADGGFGAAPGQSSSELYSAWAAHRPRGAGRRPAERAPRRSLACSTRCARKPAPWQGAGDLERTILALHACGAPVHVRSPAAIPLQSCCACAHERRLLRQPGQPHGIRGLRAARRRALGRRPAVRAAGRWLARQQNADGGFGFAARGAGSDVDDTAAALQALVAAGARPPAAAARRRPRGRVPAPRAEPRRRLPPAARRRIERPVHRLGDAGPRRAGRDADAVTRAGQPLSARLPGEPRGARTEACATRAPARSRRCG